MELRLSGHVKLDDVVKAFNYFERNAPQKPNDIKILTIVIMTHGSDNDR